MAAALALAAASGRAAEPTLQEQAQALRATPPSPEALFRLKQDMGAERFKTLNREVAQQVLRPPGGLKPGERATCDPAGQRLVDLTYLAVITEDEAQWRTRMAEVVAALDKRAALQAAASERVERALGAASIAADPFRAELARRVGKDQFVRTTLPDLSPAGGWADGMSAPVRHYLNTFAITEMCAADRDNTDWLKAELRRRGWPLISRDGKTADQQAWLLVQHADHDPAWQAEVLGQLAELTAKGETNPKNYAYLFDRVAMKHGGPQRYGTQGHCVGTRDWRPFDDEAGDLDARRTSVGLPSEAEYIAGAKALCFKADGA
jgi:hypothetical protein